MAVHLRIAGVHLWALRAHLFPGDGNESVAFALCGRHRSRDVDVLLVHEVHVIPYADCPTRTPERVTWRTEALEPLLRRAANNRWGVVKFHSHPTGWPAFSSTDDESDKDLFPSIYGWVDDEGPHASVIALPNGDMLGRSIDASNGFADLDRISLVGDEVAIIGPGDQGRLPAHAERHAQLFGSVTTQLLRSLCVGVVGCSGTGGLVAEMLARLGVRQLVLVDPDLVEYRNLNRIVGTGAADAALRRTKVDAIAESVTSIGLGIEVDAIAALVATPRAVRALAGCDIVFGCMDSHDGRRTLNRLATFYVLPYFDCGVSLAADGRGGIEHICAASHYLQPGGSTLLGRKVIRQDRADAEALARRDPAEYARRRAEKYIAGADEDRPAVISVNALAAAMMVNEMLARLHPFRDDPNDRFASVRFVFSQMRLDTEPEAEGAGPYLKLVGRGDVEPLLDMPELTSKDGSPL